ncbi:MAG: 2-oxoacid:acceptor oxidoreductase family protein [Endomicrobiales bacterium]|jgi:2-oxoglutarate ferredoxin oxidoreductase subunit gamma
MQSEIIIAGFGGQGVLFGGTLLAQTAVEQGLQTTWFPNYGAEMRGGTANSTVVIADHDIGSPVALHPTVLIAMNEQSFKKFLPRITDGGMVIINSSLISPEIAESQIRATNKKFTTFSVPATEIASTGIGNVQTANVVMVGVFLKQSRFLTIEHARAACEAVLVDKPKLIPVNQKALEHGYHFKK